MNAFLKSWLEQHDTRNATEIVRIYNNIIHQNIKNVNSSLLIRCCKKSLQFDRRSTIKILHHMNNIHSKTMLINIYADSLSSSCLQKAVHVFKSTPIHKHDTVSIKCMMKCYMRHNQHKNAIALYQQFNDIKHHDDDSRVLFLKACIKSDDIDKGHTFIQHIQHINKHSIKLITAVIDFYANCGDIHQAICIFESIPTNKKDIICINAMMTAYIANKQCNNAMLLYEKLEHKHYDDTSHLLYIKASINTQQYIKGHELIHKLHPIKTHNIQLINTCIDFYCNTSDINSALNVFNSIPNYKKDIVTVGCMMKCYMKCNLNRKAIALYEEFNAKMYYSDTLHLLYLKACINMNLRDKGKMCIDQHFVNPKRHNIEFVNTVLSFYGYINDIDSACRLFELIPQNKKDVVSINAMMKCYMNHNTYNNAILLYENEMRNGNEMDDISHLLYIKSCGNLNLYHKAQTVIDRYISELHCRSIEFINSVIDFYSDYNDISAAFDVFNSIPTDKKDAISINVMLKCCIRNAKSHNAVLLYEEHESLLVYDDTSHLLYIKACLNCNNYENASRLIHKHINEIHEHCIEFITTVIDWFGNYKDIHTARCIFDSISSNKMNIVCVNSMINVYNENHMFEEALLLYEQYDALHNDVSHVLYLKACTNSEHYDKAKIVMNRYMDEIETHDIEFINSCIDVYGNNGYIDKALDIFNRVPDDKKDIVTTSVMMHTLFITEAYDSALKLFYNYKGDKNAYLYSIALNVCGAAVCSSQGLDIISDLYGESNMDLISDCNIQAAIIRFYAKIGDKEKALHVFREIDSKILDNDKECVVYCAIMDCYAKFGSMDQLLALFHKLKDERLKLNDSIYGVVLNGCSHAGLVEDALYIFKQLKEDESLVVSQKLFNIMMDCLSRNDMLNEAENLYQTMSN